MTARGSLGFSAAAIALVATLIANYVVSQFLRNSIGVIAPNLAQELLHTRPDRTPVQHVLFPLCRHPDSAGHGA